MTRKDMAREDINPYSWKATKKSIKDTSKQLNITKTEVREWLNKVEAKQRKDLSTSSVPRRRNPGRMDGVQWNGSSFVCPAHVEDDERCFSLSFPEVDEEANNGWEEDFEWKDERPFVVSLVDIAKPMKRKGVAKDFEVVDKLKPVIIWDAEDESDASDGLWEDDWEDVLDETKVPSKSYAEALRGAG